MRLEEDEQAAVLVRSATRPASRRSRPDGGRSRRRRRRFLPRRGARAAALRHETPRVRPRLPRGSHLRARAPRAQDAALRRLCSPAIASGPSYGASSSPRTTAGTFASQPRRAPRPPRANRTSCDGRGRRSSRRRRVAAARRSSGPIRLPPRRAIPSRCPRFRRAAGRPAPISQAGSRPSRSRQKAIMLLVVVLPCAPATTIESRSDTSSASSSARAFPGTRPANAVETNASQPSGGRDGSSEISTSIPSSCSRYGVRTRSQPRTSAPHARASKAYALMPAPPIPAIQNLRPSRGEGNELLGDLVRGIRPGELRHRGRHLRKPRGSSSSERINSGARPTSDSWTTTAPPRCSK